MGKVLILIEFDTEATRVYSVIFCVINGKENQITVISISKDFYVCKFDTVKSV